jgi:tetratricopeptide (TPR) repeat protein
LESYKSIDVKVKKNMKSPQILLLLMLLWSVTAAPVFGRPAPGVAGGAAVVQEQNLEVLYGQAIRYIQAGKYELAVALLESIYEKVPGYRDVSARLGFVRKKLGEKTLAERIRSEYARGAEAYRMGDWADAIVLFERVAEISPAYKDTSSLLESAKRNNVANQLYTQAMQARERGDLKSALDYFRQAKSSSPKYQDVDEQILKTSIQLESVNKEAQALYTTGVNHLQAKQWEQAIAVFEKVQAVSPNFSDVAEKLTEAKANRVADIKLGDAARGRMMYFYVGGGLLALIALPLAGLLMFSPVSRARALALSGNAGAAAQIYESLLKASPGKIPLYKDLADLYVTLNRRDKQAMHVYKTVVQFDLTPRKLPEIKSIVSQNYMGDSDADG